MDKNSIQAYIDILRGAFYDYPVVKMGDAFGTLYAAKKEMDDVNKEGYDNYAHRLGMCLNAQKGAESAAYSATLGLLKEAKDIVQKIPKKGIKEALKDSVKDLKNNAEGLYYGLTNPEQSCRIWLKDLNYGENKWER